jgi:DNA-binding transcriptional regulator YiaG
MNNTQLVAVATVRRALEDGDVRRLRESLRISVRETAAVLGVSPASVSRWETGHERPSTERALQLAALVALWLEAVR